MSQYIDSVPSSFKLVVHLFSAHSENDSFISFDLLRYQTYVKCYEVSKFG